MPRMSFKISIVFLSLFMSVFFIEACKKKKHASTSSNAGAEGVGTEVAVANPDDLSSAPPLGSTDMGTSAGIPFGTSTTACSSPSIMANGTCYPSLAAITSSADCQAAGGYFLGSPSSGTGTDMTVSTSPSTSGGVVCYASLATLPQSVCASMSYVFENGTCYTSVESIKAEADCFADNGIFAPDASGSTTGSCFKSFAEITSQATCTAAVNALTNPTHGVWSGSACAAGTSTGTGTGSGTGTGTALATAYGGTSVHPCAGKACVPSLAKVDTFALTDPKGGAFGNWGPPQWTFFADMDGDAYPDIVTYNAAQSTLYILFNQKGTGFTVKAFSQVSAPVGSSLTNTASSIDWGSVDDVSVMDFKGLKKASVVTYDKTANVANIFYLSSDNSALNGERWVTNKTWGSTDYTWFGNYDGKGPGLLSANASSALNLSLNNAYASFTSGASAISSYLSGMWGTANFSWAADVNGDGKTEIVSASGVTGNCAVSTIGNITSFSLGAGASSFTAKSCPAGAWGPAAQTFVGDFTGHGNGSMDIASVACGTSVYLKVYDGSGCFKAQTVTLPTSSTTYWGTPNYTLAGDFNGDGIMDFVSFPTTTTAPPTAGKIIYSVPGSTLSYNVALLNNLPAGTMGPSGAYLQTRAGSPYRGAVQRGYLGAVDVYQNGITDIVALSGSNVNVMKIQAQ